MAFNDQTKLNSPLKLSDAERRLLDGESNADRESRLQVLLAALEQLPFEEQTSEIKRANIDLEIAGLQLDLDNRDSAWHRARAIVEIFINHQQFEDAALACQYVYLCEKEDAISAIGQAAWLAVTYPVNPHLTVNVLDHIIDETPDESDGAAVAAATAHYVSDIRGGEEHEQLQLFTGAMLARVARRHSNVESQEKFERWVKILELDDPEKFLVRLRNVIDVMVQEDWWFDRDALSNALPDTPDQREEI